MAPVVDWLPSMAHQNQARVDLVDLIQGEDSQEIFLILLEGKHQGDLQRNTGLQNKDLRDSKVVPVVSKGDIHHQAHNIEARIKKVALVGIEEVLIVEVDLLKRQNLLMELHRKDGSDRTDQRDKMDIITKVLEPRNKAREDLLVDLHLLPTGPLTSEPAKYEFSYEVDDVETGTMFGHSEQRNGDMTIGQYNVILADGRKQVVQYEANKDGFKPEIRYEGTDRGGVVSGFGRGSSRGNGDQTYRVDGAKTYASAEAQLGITAQGGRYQPQGFDQGTSSGYPGGRPNNVQDSFGFPSTGVDSGYPGRPGGSSFNNRSPGNPSNLDGQGYPSGPQGGRGSPRGGALGINNQGTDQGYPSGGPSGLRGSGY